MPARRIEELKKVFDYSFVVITCLIVFITITGIFNLYLFLLVASVIFLGKNIYFDPGRAFSYGISWFDLSILAVALAEGVSYATSAYRENSFYSMVDVSFFILFFYWIRFNLRFDYQRKAIFIFLTVLGVYLFIDGLLAFLSGYFQMRSAGFRDLSDFRNLLSFGSPVGIPTAEWSTIYLACLPFSLGLFFIKFDNEKRDTLFLLIPPMLILIIPIISCFRGMYVAIAAFAITGSALFIVYNLASFKKVLQFNALIFLPLALVVFISPLRQPVVSTMLMFHTTSQVRSFEGRESVWEIGAKMVKEHPLTGIGSNNFPLLYEKYKEQNDPAPFSGGVFNLFLQILIEKGVIGLAAYCFLIVSFFYTSHRRIKSLQDDWSYKVVVALFMSAVAATLVRDLSYSSLLNNKGAFVLVWLMFAFSTQRQEKEISPQKGYLRKAVLFVAILLALSVFLVIGLKSLSKGAAEDCYLAFVKDLNHGELPEAQLDIDTATRKARGNALYWASRGLLEERILNNEFDGNRFLRTNVAFGDSDKSDIEAGIEAIKRAIELSPCDDEFYHDLGWLYVLEQNYGRAKSYFTDAIHLNNNVPLYHISMGLLLEKENEKDSAMMEYRNAICQLPSLLDSQFFLDLEKRSPNESKQLVSECIQELEKEYQTSHDPIIAAKLGKLYLFQAEKGKAKHLLERATNELPNLSRPWLYLGDLYQSTSEGEATQFYKKAAFLDNSDIYPLFRLGQIYEKNDQSDSAINCYKLLLVTVNYQYAQHASELSIKYCLTSKDERIIMKDYLVPEGLLKYCSPIYDVSSVYSQLSTLYAKKGDTTRAEEYLDLANSVSN